MKVYSVKNNKIIKRVSEDYYDINLDAVASLRLFGYYHNPDFGNEWLVDADFCFGKINKNEMNAKYIERFEYAEYLSGEVLSNLRNKKLNELGI